MENEGGIVGNVQVGSRTEQCPECEFAWMVGGGEVHADGCSRGDLNEFKVRFTYHPPKEEQVAAFQEIRAQAMYLARYITQASPDCRERSLAITKLEEVVMWANAGIARRT